MLFPDYSPIQSTGTSSNAHSKPSRNLRKQKSYDPAMVFEVPQTETLAICLTSFVFGIALLHFTYTYIRADYDCFAASDPARFSPRHGDI
jgi:hypothetical protein